MEATARTRNPRSLLFLQAEDGIRDRNVTGVQTCALPICCRGSHAHSAAPAPRLGRELSALGARHFTGGYCPQILRTGARRGKCTRLVEKRARTPEIGRAHV